MGPRSFKSQATEDINYGRASKEALKTLPKELHRKAQVKLARLGAAPSIQDLREIRGNRCSIMDHNGSLAKFRKQFTDLASGVSVWCRSLEEFQHALDAPEQEP